MDTTTPESTDIHTRLLESAKRLGFEMNAAELERWMDAVRSEHAADVQFDDTAGVFGHRLSLLDFKPDDLARFRTVGKIVEFTDVPGQVETALALSGSAAQSKIQTYPGDCDYFERVNILAGTHDEACATLSTLMREKAFSAMSGPGYQLIEVKFGSYPFDLIVADRLHKKGSPISWTPKTLRRGYISGWSVTGTKERVSWDHAANDPGWCKLDWVIADPANGQLANASNMLDVTWEAPDGTLRPLDGYLDGYFQEVYLDGESAPIFNKIVANVTADSLDSYVEQLRREVSKYVSGDSPNYGKAAKRMYNIFRLNGRYEEAAFLRELFDEPAALLYQVHALMRTVSEAREKSRVFSVTSILDQLDELIMNVIRVLEGEPEVEIVRHLLGMYRGIAHHSGGQPLDESVSAAQAGAMRVVNNFFYSKMIGHPRIKSYVDECCSSAAT